MQKIKQILKHYLSPNWDKWYQKSIDKIVLNFPKLYHAKNPIVMMTAQN